MRKQARDSSSECMGARNEGSRQACNQHMCPRTSRLQPTFTLYSRLLHAHRKLAGLLLLACGLGSAASASEGRGHTR